MENASQDLPSNLSNPVNPVSESQSPASELPLVGPFLISIEQFAGPIDLLLHLVKIRELEIEKVSLALVADQYLSLLTTSKIVDIDLASEYLVIAATLLSVKASFLLDEPVVINQSTEDVEDPAEELLRRLREAQVYREGASRLSIIPQLGSDVFNAVSTEKIPVIDGGIAPHDVTKLAKAFEKVLAARKFHGAYIVERDAVPVAERMRMVSERILQEKRVHFMSLFSKGESRAVLVTTFIAILELCKQKVIKIDASSPESLKRGVLTDEIYLVPVEEGVADAQNFNSEFDLGSSEENVELPKIANG